MKDDQQPSLFGIPIVVDDALPEDVGWVLETRDPRQEPRIGDELRSPAGATLIVLSKGPGDIVEWQARFGDTRRHWRTSLDVWRRTVEHHTVTKLARS